jgi:hypothetical protein
MGAKTAATPTRQHKPTTITFFQGNLDSPILGVEVSSLETTGGELGIILPLINFLI